MKTNSKAYLKFIIGVVVIGIVYFIVCPRGGKHDNFGDKEAECRKNLIAIAAAVDAHNLNSKDLIINLDEKGLQTLVDGKFLKAVPNSPTQKCKYAGYGFDEAEGHVYCLYHGETGTHLIKGQPSPFLAEKNSGDVVRRSLSILAAILVIWAFACFKQYKAAAPKE